MLKQDRKFFLKKSLMFPWFSLMRFLITFSESIGSSDNLRVTFC